MARKDIKQIRDAIELAIDWYDEAPIKEVERVEKAIEFNFPYRELKEALKKLKKVI